jgi:hypothetical protein
MKKIIMLAMMCVCGMQANGRDVAGKPVDEIFSLLDQAFIKAFENRTLSTQALDPAAKRDFETTVNAALAVANRAPAHAEVQQGLAMLPDQLTQLLLMTEFLKNMPAGAKKQTINDVKALRAQANQLERIGLHASVVAIQPELYAKWDNEASNIEVERSRKEKLLFKSAKLKEEHLLNPEQRAFFSLFIQMAPGRDLTTEEMDALLLQTGVTSSRKTKLINGYAIENLIDAMGKYAYLLTKGKADAPQRETVASYAYDIQQQLRKLYGISKDEALLINKAPVSAALLYKISSTYKAIWDKLLKELGA